MVESFIKRGNELGVTLNQLTARNEVKMLTNQID